MKKFISILSAILFAILPAVSYKKLNILSVSADSVYYRVITHDTPFYQTENSTSPLFYLPYTYYVKVLSKGEKMSHIECYGDGNTITLDGFVPTEKLFLDNLPVSNPFVAMDIITVTTAVLYQDSSLTTQSQYIFENRSLHYYGHLDTPNGKIYYVGYNNRLGYVKEVDVFPFSIPNHPNELTFLTPENPPSEKPTQSPPKNDFFGIKVAIVICLLFAGVIALFFALSKRPEKNLAISYYDDNDYE